MYLYRLRESGMYLFRKHVSIDLQHALSRSGYAFDPSWRQTYKLTFRRQLMCESTRLEERNAMVIKSLAQLNFKRRCDWKQILAITSKFGNWWPLKAKRLTRGQICLITPYKWSPTKNKLYTGYRIPVDSLNLQICFGSRSQAWLCLCLWQECSFGR